MNPQNPTTTTIQAQQVLEQARHVIRTEREAKKKEYQEEIAREKIVREEKARMQAENEKEKAIKLLRNYKLGQYDIREVFLPLLLENLSTYEINGLLEFRKIAPKIEKGNHAHPGHLEEGRYHHPAIFNSVGYRLETWRDCKTCDLMAVLYNGMCRLGNLERGGVTREKWDTFVAGWIARGNKPNPKDILEYKMGAAGFGDHFMVAKSDFMLLPFRNMKIIVLPGVNVRGLQNIGKYTTLYFMDEFRVVGENSVPIFPDTLMDEKAKKAEEREMRRERLKRTPILCYFVRDK